MWIKEAPKEVGYYWYRCKSYTEIVKCNTFMGFITFNSDNWEGCYTAKEMLLDDGEFWSERIVEPVEDSFNCRCG
jgi:hypothetical protein